MLLIGAASLARAQVGSVVTVDSDNVLLVNGRKVFSIAVTPGPPLYGRTAAGDDALQELREAGALLYRMPQFANWSSSMMTTQQLVLDWAAQHDMYVWLNLRELSQFPSTDTTTPASLRSLVNTFKNHPALGLWKNFDEAWWAGVSVTNLKNGYDVIKQEDTNHPVVQTHAPRGTVADLQPYNAAADVLALDIYPVAVPPPSNPPITNTQVSQLGDWTKVLAQIADGQKQFWMIEQIAFSGTTPPTKTLVFPTFRQSRFMAYEAIVNGSRGLAFFGGNVTATLNAQDAPLGWNWTFWNDVLKRVVQEVGDHSPLAPALVAPNSSLAITMSGTSVPDIEFCVREAAPYLYIIATKREGATTNVTFSGLPAWATNAEVMFESPRIIAATGAQLTDSFAPHDVHVYRFAQSNVAPTILFAPQSRTNYPGIRGSFAVFADGTGPLAYQWRRNETNIPGATSPTFTTTEAGAYDAVVTGFGSVTSAPALLVLKSYDAAQTPTITAQPQAQFKYPGATANFSVAVSTNGPFSFQWRKNGAPLSDTAAISGATSWSLTLSNVSALDAGSYDVIVSGFSSVTSSVAALDVIINTTNTLILYEPFAYTNIGGPLSSNTPADWNYGGAGANDLNVTAGNLTYAGLADSIGNSVTNGGAGLGVRRLFGSGISNGVVYFSALFRIGNLAYGVWNGASAQAGSLQATDNTAVRCGVMIRSNSASGYVIGVQKGGTGATATFNTATEFHAGDTVFFVGKYDFTVSPNTATLWINPPESSLGAAVEPGGSIFASTGTDGFVIDRFNIRQNTATSVPASMQWDELRVAGAWSDVTPPPAPRLLDAEALGDGSFRFAYTNRSGRTYTIYASTNLTDWDPIALATQVSPGVFQFSDASATNHTQRFYQLRAP
jgi:hypothetical protein